MGSIPTKFLIDGIDRLGKSSLIRRILDVYGYHLVVHYDKPQVLENTLLEADDIKTAPPEELSPEYQILQANTVENIARRLYQEQANFGMFELMKSDAPIIFDRTHLGEMVYAPLYRKYDGSYVYEMEQDLIESKPYTYGGDIRLILLTSSNTDMLADDGLSFDPTKKLEEQNLFIDAFNRSKLVNKVIVDVHNGQGGYRTYNDIFNEAMLKPAE